MATVATLPHIPDASVAAVRDRLIRFMEDRVYPAEAILSEHESDDRLRWTVHPLVEELKEEARSQGLWNLFLPDLEGGPALSNVDYAGLCEIMGRSPIAPELFNCSAPDSGNMEVLHKYGSPDQKRRWLEPLLAGEIRSCFLMTEPDVASSDATNIETRIRRVDGGWSVSGRKWWITGALDPRAKIGIVLGVSAPDAERHRRHSMLLVPLDAPGVKVGRRLRVLGFDDAPSGHAYVDLEDVHVPAEAMILGEGRGFEIAQGRLGPGRIHHCMRCIGLAERALELMAERARTRVAFGRPLAEQGVVRERIARSRIEIDQARLLTLLAARRIDEAGPKAARAEIAMIKVVAPNVAFAVLDRAIQTFGSAGLDHDFLAPAYAGMRALRFADGPDEVHLEQVAKLELARA